MLPRVLLHRRIVIVAIGIVSLYYFLYGALPPISLPPWGSDRELKPIALEDPAQYHRIEFGSALVKLFTDNKPAVASLTKLGSAGVIGFKEHNDVPLKRPDVVSVGTSEVRLLSNAHENFIDQVKNVSLPFLPGSQGIVSTAGGALLPVFIISLRMLRRTGNNLPVELFLRSDEEHGQYLCDDLLPSMNARCVIIDDYIKPSKRRGSFKLEKFQYKIFSVLFSSFEDVLLLDADNFPVEDPTYVFESEPFLSKGMITWPDFWISTASERFYAIQGTPTPPTNLRASTESGQVLVSKRSHAAALLVAAYYNFYGPTHYYPLLTQGGPGEGDKETFLAGAAAVGAPFYQVSAPVSILGYQEHGELKGVAMLQHDPVGDHDGLANPGPFTVHANFPKMEPNSLFGEDSPIIDSVTGKHHRLWGDETSAMKTFGKDVERAMWGEIHYVTCNLGGVFLQWKAVSTNHQRKGTCQLIEDHMDIVFPVKDTTI
ncbi:hypothetical protein AAFC00_005143 [Neodothiora populina]|uniref:Alpha-1,2-mannosyltransferase n=1 Tax=Neodothiora populina TaxID=2781224 RepID=A0ABR3PJY5_9PEZI